MADDIFAPFSTGTPSQTPEGNSTVPQARAAPLVIAKLDRLSPSMHSSGKIYVAVQNI
jgi:hypothetical protein